MTTGEAAYLALVLVSFGVFVIVMAMAGRQTRPRNEDDAPGAEERSAERH